MTNKNHSPSHSLFSFYLFLILMFVIIGRPQDMLPFLKPIRPALIVGIITGMTTLFALRKNVIIEFIKRPLCKKYMLFYMIMILGIPFAYHRRVAFEFIFIDYSVNILLFWIFITQVRSWDKLKKVLFVLVFSTFIYAAATLMQGDFIGTRFYFGTMFDPNDLSYFLVSFLPINFLFIMNRGSNARRTLFLINFVMSVLLILMTGSRGGFLGLLLVLLLIFWTPLIIRKKSIKIIFLILLTVILISKSTQIDFERLKSSFELKEDYNVTGEQGRLSLWKKGIKFAFSNPFTGVGVKSYPKALGMERVKEGSVSARWQVVHNSYIEVASEVGLIGFILFFSIIIECFKTFSIPKKRKKIKNDMSEIILIKKVLFIGFAGHCLTALFLTQAFSIYFTTFFALSFVIQHLSVTQNPEN